MKLSSNSTRQIIAVSKGGARGADFFIIFDLFTFASVADYSFPTEK